MAVLAFLVLFLAMTDFSSKLFKLHYYYYFFIFFQLIKAQTSFSLLLVKKRKKKRWFTFVGQVSWNQEQHNIFLARKGFIFHIVHDNIIIHL